MGLWQDLLRRRPRLLCPTTFVSRAGITSTGATSDTFSASHHESTANPCSRQCLLDSYESTHCPACSGNICSYTEDGKQEVLVQLHNEGGVQPDLDILPVLVEEAYLKYHPEERKAKAFLEFCREGDQDAVLDLLAATENPEDDDVEGNDDEDLMDDEMAEPQQMTSAHVMRYRDPLGGMESALHIGVLKRNAELVWLMLLLASHLPVDLVPTDLKQVADVAGLARGDQTGLVDMRTLKDRNGMTASEYSEIIADLLDVRILRPPV